jgi:hypothetical protein
MLTRVATTLKRLVACLFTAQSSATVETPSNTANHSPVQSGQPCKVARKPRQSASKKPKRKTSVAQAGTTAQSRKPRQKPAQQTSGENGLQQATPASQPASKSAKRKPKAVQPTTAAKSRKPASKPAQTTSGKRGRPRKTPA